VIYEKQGDCPKVVEAMKKALDIDQDYLAARLMLGKGLVCGGNPAKGIKELERVQKSDPQGPMGKEAQGEILKLKHSKFKGIPKP
jgi:predicted Zn-dependent protease